MKILINIAIGLLLSACTSMSQVEQDMAAIELPTNWAQPSATATATQLDSAWWTIFADEKLNQLLELSLANNSTVLIASLNLQKALLQADLAGSSRLPKLSVSGGKNASKPLDGGASKHSYGVNGSISYNIDLFGRLAKEHDVRKLQARATAQDVQQIWLAITTQTASLYWQLAYLNHQISLQLANLVAAEETLEMVKLRFEAGKVAKMEVLNAENNLRQLNNAYQSSIDGRQQLRTQLAILVGQPPQTRLDEQEQLNDFDLPVFDYSLPAEVLAHRPDVKSAELKLRASLANVQVQERGLYPNLMFNVGVSGSNQHLANVLADPIGSLSLNLLMPIFNWPQNQLQLKVSKLDYQTALIQFRDVLYTALAEVENSISAQQKLSSQYKNLRLNYENSQKLEKMSEIRYLAGADSLKDLLDAQKSTRDTELSLLNTRYQLYQNFLMRYLALGGQFNGEEQ